MRLRAAKLVEGRYPSLMVAGKVVAVAGQKAQHIRDRGFDSQYYRDMIVALVSRPEIKMPQSYGD